MVEWLFGVNSNDWITIEEKKESREGRDEEGRRREGREAEEERE